jgi:hypothetical protein
VHPPDESKTQHRHTERPIASVCHVSVPLLDAPINNPRTDLPEPARSAHSTGIPSPRPDSRTGHTPPPLPRTIRASHDSRLNQHNLPVACSHAAIR